MNLIKCPNCGIKSINPDEDKIRQVIECLMHKGFLNKDLKKGGIGKYFEVK